MAQNCRFQIFEWGKLGPKIFFFRVLQKNGSNNFSVKHTKCSTYGCKPNGTGPVSKKYLLIELWDLSSRPIRMQDYDQTTDQSDRCILEIGIS